MCFLIDYYDPCKVYWIMLWFRSPHLSASLYRTLSSHPSLVPFSNCLTAVFCVNVALGLRSRVPQMLFHKIIFRFSFSHSHRLRPLRPFRCCCCRMECACFARLRDGLRRHDTCVCLCASARHSSHFPNEPIVLMRMQCDDIPPHIHFSSLSFRYSFVAHNIFISLADFVVRFALIRFVRRLINAFSEQLTVYKSGHKLNCSENKYISIFTFG